MREGKRKREGHKGRQAREGTLGKQAGSRYGEGAREREQDVRAGGGVCYGVYLLVRTA